jgi:hypothetical protein
MQSPDGGPIKIGSTRNIKERHRKLQSRYGQTLEILAVFDGGLSEEREIQEKFSHLRLGRTEQFRPGADLMAFLGRPMLGGEDLGVAQAMPSANNKRTVIIKISVADHRELRIEAAKEGVSMAMFARKLVEAGLAKLTGGKPPAKKGGKT